MYVNVCLQSLSIKTPFAVYIDFKICFQKSLSLASTSVQNSSVAEAALNSVTMAAATATRVLRLTATNSWSLPGLIPWE